MSRLVCQARHNKGASKTSSDGGCIEAGFPTTPIINGMEGDFPDYCPDDTGPNDACCTGSSVGGICCSPCRSPALGEVLDTSGMEYVDETCCKGMATFESMAAVCSGFCRRRLFHEDYYERNPSKERSMEIIEKVGANPDAAFVIEHDVLSRETCRDLANYTEYSLQTDSNPLFPFGHHNVYTKYITVSKLVEIIGKESAHRIVETFAKYRGEDEPITEVYLQRHSPSTLDEMYFTDWHKDCYSTMEVQLGSFEEPQEWLAHLTRDGPVRYEGLPGMAMIHGDDIVHGTPPFFGDTPMYLLVVKHHPEERKNYHPKKVFLNKQILDNMAVSEL